MGWDSLDSNATGAAVTLKPAFTPSPYQEALFEEVRTGTGNIVVEAVAGSGKSTSLVEVCKIVQEVDPHASVLFCAFNKSIVTELIAKVPRGITCKTINAIGHAALVKHYGGKIELDDRKYKTIARDIVADLGIIFRKPQESRKAVDQLVSFAQSTLVDLTDLDAVAAMAEQYNIEIPDDERGASVQDFYEIARLTLAAGIQMANEQQVISFNDQIWLPTIFGARPPKVKYALIDECQDLSRAKLELLLLMQADRYFFVGDRKQSIYGFAGADPSSFQNIIERTEAKVMPLSICYRCPKSHIELAKEIVPQIEAHEKAKEGVIEVITQTELRKRAQSGTLILCRFTAPLIRLCIQFIKERRSATVKGREIGESLAKFAREALLRSGLPYDMMPEALDQHVEKQVAKLAGREDVEGLIQSIKDKAEGVLACFDSFAEARNLNALEMAIQSIFSDADSAIQLSTLHRAKGLEAETVAILGYDILPFSWQNMLPWQREQEENIEYVAKTRSKDTLYLVRLK